MADQKLMFLVMCKNDNRSTNHAVAAVGYGALSFCGTGSAYCWDEMEWDGSGWNGVEWNAKSKAAPSMKLKWRNEQILDDWIMPLDALPSKL